MGSSDHGETPEQEPSDGDEDGEAELAEPDGEAADLYGHVLLEVEEDAEDSQRNTFTNLLTKECTRLEGVDWDMGLDHQ